MAIKTRVTKKGIISERVSDLGSETFDLEIPQRGFGQFAEYEYHEHSPGSGQTFTDVTGSQLFIDGGHVSFVSGASALWLTASSKLQPETTRGVYSVTLNCEMDGAGGNPSMNFDLVPSGVTLAEAEQLRRRQSAEHIIRAGINRSHFTRTFQLISDETMFSSGVIFLCSTDGTEITVNSASVTIVR